MASLATAMIIGGTSILAAIAADPEENPKIVQKDQTNLREGGIPYSLIHSVTANYGNITSSFSPYSRPPRNSTQNLNEIFATATANICNTNTENTIYQLREDLGSIPISTAEQSISAVSLPTRASYFTSDTRQLINQYPLTYFEYASNDTSSLMPMFSDSMSKSGISSEMMKPNTPIYDPIMIYSDPWGPGGALLDLWHWIQRDIIGTEVPPRSTIIQNAQ